MRYHTLLFLFITLASCSTVVRKTVEPNVLSYPIKNVAILPFNVTPDTNRLLNGITSESLLRGTKLSRYRFQRYLYIWLKKRPSKYNTSFQDFMKTNELIKQKKFPDLLHPKLTEELCSLLKVDAVVFGNIVLKKPMSQEESNIINGALSLGVAPSNKISFKVSIYDAKNNLRWTKMYTGRGNVEDEKIVEAVMKRVSKTILFTK